MKAGVAVDLTPAQLRQLYKLLGAYMAEIRAEQPLAGDVVAIVRRWVESEQRYNT